MGRPHSRWFWRRPLLQRIAAYAPGIDILETGQGDKREEPPIPETAANAEERLHPGAGRKGRHWRYLQTVGACILTTVIATPSSTTVAAKALSASPRARSEPKKPGPICRPSV